MQILVLYVITAVVFLGLDALGLSKIMRPLFETHIPNMLREDVQFVAAGVFYLIYVAGLLYFVSVPALRDNAPAMALFNGAILGALAYGTFEFTAFSVLKGWHWQMVATDVAWGAALTAVSAWAGVMLTRWVMPG
ncbi:Uncharacterized membrane protein [Modicisalibacter ilicicola DSM 19980]|uniref:Uncharacterized membrane protein n=1 Tax=Modicisalibacter ilicicola DSM 19980 TaxID=1121942 RepID=A0A1M5DFF2_9GAMM|nr:DUF2177 family protein [Halomonas ilicicola]SHF65422.1 Uncharacterized membrane protein [Halomonas ilicicola DSM 19980]